MHIAKGHWISRLQRKARTRCGHRVPVEQIAVNAEGTCPACRASVDYEFTQTYEIASALYVLMGKDPTRLRIKERPERNYRTVYFL